LNDTSDRPASVAAEATHPDPSPEHPATPEAALPEDTDAEDAPPTLAASPAAMVPDESLAAPDEGQADEDADRGGPDTAAPPVTFADLGLSEQVARAVADAGYVVPTPIQEQAIPVVLMGRDVMGTAQTGTGKTAGFVLPMLDILASGRAKARMPRSLILEPTRELALQVAENFVKYGKHLNLVHALLIGGESLNDQRAVLDKGVDVLIATPGRLLDLFERGRILLADCKLLVIDEADRMLDMGFIPDVERIVSMLPPLRQTLFFSATMGPEVRRLAEAFLSNPKEIAASAPASVAITIKAGLVWVRETDKREALRRLVRREDVQNALIFCNRKTEVDTLYKSLRQHGFSVGALHGDMDQPTRFATLNKFKADELQLLCCSDVAARGLDIGGLSHVFNFDVPYHAEDYVHRIGRTGRAGREGHAYTIATADDVRNVAAIEKLTGKPIARIEVEGLDPVTASEMEEAAARPKRGRGAAPRGGASRGGTDRGGTGRAPSRTAEPRAEPPGDRAPASTRPPRERAAPRRAPAVVEAAPLVEERSQPEHSGERPRERPDHRRDRGPASPPRDRGPAADRGPDPAVGPREEAYRRRDRDDLGPSVRGFGEAVPAFMLIPVPRPRRDAAADQDQDVEQEAA